MLTFTLLSTDEFAAELLCGVHGARSRVLVQLMTFDGDGAGLPVAEAMLAAVQRVCRCDWLWTALPSAT